MVFRNIKGKNRSQGFTLIEVILSLAVTVLLLGGAAGIFKQGIDVWQKHQVKSEEFLASQFLFHRMGADIRASRLGGNWQGSGVEGMNLMMPDGSVVAYEYNSAGKELSRKIAGSSVSPLAVADNLDDYYTRIDVLHSVPAKKYLLYTVAIRKKYSDGRVEGSMSYCFSRN